MTPRVSVFMPLHDARPFVEEAIGSITRQTLTDLELVIVENGSRDGSREIARRAAGRDTRIRVFEHDQALGVAGAADLAIREARAGILARMDHDDVSAPDRLARQLAVLERDPATVAVGTLCVGIDASGRQIRPPDRWRLVRPSPLPPFPHGSVMFRRDAYERAGRYRTIAGSWEDVDLFLRLSRLGAIAVVPEALYRYRYHASTQTSRTGPDLDVDPAARILRCLEAWRREGAYEHVLSDTTFAANAQDVAHVVAHRDGVRLWARQPPGPRFATSAGPLLAARRVWHTRSPRTLRAGLRLGIRARNAAASRRLRGRPLTYWTPLS